MPSLPNYFQRVAHIANKRDLAIYVAVTTLVCWVVALGTDIAVQLIFFEGWVAAFRSWSVTSALVLVIATPVSWYIGRSHLDLRVAQQMVVQHLAALEKAHEATQAAHLLAESLARHDALTGLPNRRVFAEALEKAVARANRGSGTYAVLSLDLDRFKPVNDVHGHAAGDIVLCEIANRLLEVARKSDTVARFGGDEFAVILEFGTSDELQ